MVQRLTLARFSSRRVSACQLRAGRSGALWMPARGGEQGGMLVVSGRQWAVQRANGAAVHNAGCRTTHTACSCLHQKQAPRLTDERVGVAGVAHHQHLQVAGLKGSGLMSMRMCCPAFTKYASRGPQRNAAAVLPAAGLRVPCAAHLAVAGGHLVQRAGLVLEDLAVDVQQGAASGGRQAG